MMLRRRLRAIDPRGPLHDIEIDLKDPTLAPHRLDQQREIGFDELAGIAGRQRVARPEKDVLGGLVADRAAAPDASRLLIVLQRLLDSREVEAPMRAEAAVLRRDHGA